MYQHEHSLGIEIRSLIFLKAEHPQLSEDEHQKELSTWCGNVDIDINIWLVTHKVIAKVNGNFTIGFSRTV